MPFTSLSTLVAAGRAQARGNHSSGAQAQALEQSGIGRRDADHTNLTSRHGRHSAVTLAGGTALPL